MTENSDDIGSLEAVSFPSSARYRLLEEIGRGGMGVVYLAEREAQDVRDLIVLKTMRTVAPDRVEALKREAGIATLLRHENIVRCYGLESIPGDLLPAAVRERIRAAAPEDRAYQRPRRAPAVRRYARPKRRPRRAVRAARTQARVKGEPLYIIVMDYVDGTDLAGLHAAHVASRVLLPCPLAAYVVARVAGALGYAHAHIIHRDVSPENILIDSQGVCKLSDFGIAVAAEAGAAGMAGKVRYAAPEILRGEVGDRRADIYSLGVVAYEILTGLPRNVAGDGSMEDRVGRARRAAERPMPAPHLVRQDVPEVLSTIVAKMVEVAPERRYADAGAVAHDLEAAYLYAGGPGPTSNSMACYMQLFDTGFRKASPEQLRHLSFVDLGDGKLAIRRSLGRDDYTEAGLALAETLRRTAAGKVLTDG